MKPAFRRRCTAAMYAVNEENRSIFVSAASIMHELGLLPQNVKLPRLLRTATAKR